MDTFRRDYDERKKPGTKENIFYDSISMTFMNRQNRSMVVGAGIVVTWEWRVGIDWEEA